MLRHFIKQHYRLLCTILLGALATVSAVAVIIQTTTKDVPTVQTAGTTVTTSVLSTSTTDTTATTTDTTTATTTTTTKKTTKKTTRRTVAPPPIVVEPDNVKDDTAKKPDNSVQKPIATNGVTIQHTIDHFGGKGNLIGIDVSRHQGDIDWVKVKNAGISFAIIRCGYRTTVSGQVYMDANFKTNIEGAIAAGIPVGVYFFSAAKNETEVLQEAAFVIEVIKPYKDNISWPVVYDFEIFDQDRLKGVSDTTVTNNAIAFMEVIAAEGYTPMLYSSRNMLRDNFEIARLSAYRIWMAQYVNTLDQKKYDGEHVVWQCASDGRVDGITGDVDLNIAYSNLTNVSPFLSPLDPTTLPTTFKDRTFTPVCEVVKVSNSVRLRISPFVETPNIWTTAQKDAVVLRTGVDAKNGWSRLEVNGITLYAKTEFLTFVCTTVTTTTTTTVPTTTTTTTTAKPTTTTTQSRTQATTTNTTTAEETTVAETTTENTTTENTTTEDTTTEDTTVTTLSATTTGD